MFLLSWFLFPSLHSEFWFWSHVPQYGCHLWDFQIFVLNILFKRCYQISLITININQFKLFWTLFILSYVYSLHSKVDFWLIVLKWDFFPSFLSFMHLKIWLRSAKFIYGLNIFCTENITIMGIRSLSFILNTSNWLAGGSHVLFYMLIR